MIGTSLSHYKILGEIGRGGMGIVYSAEDTRLKRIVALKVLPAAALSNSDDRARFFREAQAAAQLSHPNIATVYAIEEAASDDGETRPFIAMEFIDGDTLGERIAEGPLKIDETVRVASLVAEALKAAHSKKIVHRDIKSGNVMISSEGVVKVLDFGLAKTNQSTMLTKLGSTLGTVAYMSPEQARGDEVDARSDLFALGVVIYEMVTGRLPFSAEYEQAIIYSILNEDPEPLTSMRTGVPVALENVVSKCLEKDRELRYQSAAGLLADLKAVSRQSVRQSSIARPSRIVETAEISGAQDAIPDSSHIAGQKISKRNTVFVAVLFTIVGLAAGWAFFGRNVPVKPPVRQLSLQFDGILTGYFPIISPDGAYWAWSATDSSGMSGMAIYDVENGDLNVVRETNSLNNSSSFSPDSRWITGLQGEQVYRISVPSGRPIPVPGSASSVAWIDNNSLVTTNEDLLLTTISLEDNRTESQPITGVAEQYVSFGQFRLIPGTHKLIGTLRDSSGRPTLATVDARTGETEVVLEGACCARPVGTSHLVYLLGGEPGQVVGQTFDPSTGRLQGAPIDLLDQAAFSGEIAVGEDDTFLEMSGTSQTTRDAFSWLDPTTKATERLSLPIADYDRMSFSPTGHQMVIEQGNPDAAQQQANIYVVDLQSGALLRLTSGQGIARAPVWSTDGKIFYAEGPIMQSDIYSKNADGTGIEVLIAEGGDYPSVSRDGKWLAYQRQEGAGADIYAKNLETGEVTPIDTLGGRQGDPAISPDGRYIAYTRDPSGGSAVSGEQRLLVRSFPDPDLFSEQILDEHADDPLWSADGNYLYYRSAGRVSRVAVTTDGVFRKLGNPERMVTYGTRNVRLASHPTDGRILIMHPANVATNQFSMTIRLTESFSQWLDSRSASND